MIWGTYRRLIDLRFRAFWRFKTPSLLANWEIEKKNYKLKICFWSKYGTFHIFAREPNHCTVAQPKESLWENILWVKFEKKLILSHFYHILMGTYSRLIDLSFRDFWRFKQNFCMLMCTCKGRCQLCLPNSRVMHCASQPRLTKR